MATILFTADPYAPAGPTLGLVRRAAGAACRRCATLASEIAVERREHRRHRSLSGVDPRLLRDLGLDRSAC